MRALVSGATGFTGGHLARALVGRGCAVRALIRARGPRTAALESEGITLSTGDLRDPDSLVRAAEGVDIIYNIGASYREAAASREAYFDINARAVPRLVDAAAAAGVRRLVHCSTVGVHGDVEHPPADEDAPLRPGDEYQRSKLEGERLGREASARTGVELVIARPSGIYGPGDRRLLKLFRGVARRRFVTLGSGEIFYHLTYVDDLVEGFRLCGEVPAAAGRTYILAGGEVTRLNELVRLIAAEAGVKPIPLRLPVWPVWIAGAICVDLDCWEDV